LNFLPHIDAEMAIFIGSWPLNTADFPATVPLGPRNRPKCDYPRIFC
jgi:hypothetical protein